MTTPDKVHVSSNGQFNYKVADLLSRLQEIAFTVSRAAEASTLEQVLEGLAGAARELANARYAALGIPDASGQLKYFKVSGLTEDEVMQIAHPPEGKGLLGAILEERHAIRLDNLTADPRSVGFPAGHPPMTSMLGVPILVGDQLIGSLYLGDRLDGQPFTEQDQLLTETIASYAGLAIAGTQLREQQKRLALLEERERIGMELHDGVIQMLYGIGMNVELLRTTKDDITPEDLNPMIKGLDESIESIRNYINDLKARTQGSETMYECVVDLVARLRKPASLEVEIDAPHQPCVLTGTRFEDVCQIVNEALSNVIRHASASRVVVMVRQDMQTFRVTITDDGQGFEVDKALSQNGLGLRNIQRRVEKYGGDLRIDTFPGKGTRVGLILPLVDPFDEG